MSEALICRKCGCNRFVTVKQGLHLRANCEDCGAYIKFVSQPLDLDNIDWDNEKIPLPKFKGKTYKDVAATEPDYIRWMAVNVKGRPGKIANEAILEFGI